ncbi:hypothetical protein SAMN04487820_106116 [Actinopolyspora mzabensis]|uniref:DUF983 domain-containing protein n=1 Tax=Actinopolyspora mzabensis TaxID=995066 RepID=A0A1G9AKY4_ACTMZ|nr:DUF983 domain-containing protein [Actinopolyspora mzabensis]SDK28036.1 hypothetical protein SAMN04487820_106116 [Actinopolyspora mzabensis]
MNRAVRGSDGRRWTLKTNIEWSDPLQVDEWELDVSGGRSPGVVMGTIVFVMIAAFLLWTPTAVIVPIWVVLALLVLILFFPVRWLVRRPWTVIADTPGDTDEHPPERWVGVVRGALTARQESARVARNIELYAEPDMNGALQPVE